MLEDSIEPGLQLTPGSLRFLGARRLDFDAGAARAGLADD
jgi:hypothetical protein